MKNSIGVGWLLCPYIERSNSERISSHVHQWTEQIWLHLELLLSCLQIVDVHHQLFVWRHSPTTQLLHQYDQYFLQNGLESFLENIVLNQIDFVIAHLIVDDCIYCIQKGCHTLLYHKFCLYLPLRCNHSGRGVPKKMACVEYVKLKCALAGNEFSCSEYNCRALSNDTQFVD